MSILEKSYHSHSAHFYDYFKDEHKIKPDPDFENKRHKIVHFPHCYENEGGGNYVYGFSRREAEKIAAGLNMPQIVYKTLNDHYVEGCEFEPADIEKSAIFREIYERIQQADEHCKTYKCCGGMIMFGFLLEKVNEATKRKFQEHGFTIIDLPVNPNL